MYESGIIYRSTRLVNWSCKLRTAISDIEVDYIEVPKMMKMKVPQHDKAYDFGFLFEFAYKVDGSDEELVVATTRPETMLGDTAVAVHPEDPRYKHLHGKFLKHPFVDRKIPIICDPILVDMNFGTGAVKITPAHDPNDYECGKRNKLEFINILNLDGTINANGGKYVGMKRYDCRTAIMEEFKQLGLYRGIKENPMRLATCSRSGDIIEPLLLPQWYVKCDQIGKEAADAVRNGEIEIIPETHKAVWFNWLDNIHDWCISRQLWWGHRVPAWLVNIDGKPSDSASPDNWVVANTEEEARAAAIKKFGTSNITLERDPDVLDTWFSSGLFPFSVMGWPNEESPDFQKYYPTSLLETGSDIIFFWVARMVMMGKFLTGKWPFKQVFLHSMVRDAHGRKMSKSLGNVIDPVDVIEGITLEGLNQTLLGGNLDPREVEKAMKGQKADFPSGISECGTDALRFALCAYTSQGRDINLDINRVVAYRNFCNKIWNATKLSFMVIGDNFSPSATNAPLGTESAIDKWILSRLAAAIEDSNKGFTEFDFARATTAIYNFWLYDLCDVYLEAIKPVMREASYTEENRNAVKQTLFSCLEEGLRLIHPFMPFLSEELWQRLPRRASQKAASICIAAYPTAVEGRTNARIEQEFTSAMELISAIRSLRMEYSVVKKVTPPLIINAKDDAFAALYTSWSSIINTLSYSATTQVARDIAEPPAGSALAIPNQYCELYVILKGLVNAEQEITKLKQKMTNAEKQLQVLVKKVTAADYTTKVPEAVREEDTKKRAASEADIAAMRKAIENFEKLSQS
jgi:valyl-tRNA synthetase